MKTITFTKMHGIGNDFVFVDFLASDKPDIAPEELQAASPFLCDRKFGVGADGVVLVLPGEAGGADFAMRMFNPDASEAEMCGNAIRCLAKLVHDRGYTAQTSITVATGGGIKSLALNVENGAVSQVT
ncbi:MAG: diaminopimelate epimerase, partial [Armatimonadetes bacterium]|nr:diaminopimelate epimerase [Armatimonadota bacterium]